MTRTRAERERGCQRTALEAAWRCCAMESATSLREAMRSLSLRAGEVVRGGRSEGVAVDGDL